MATAPPMDWPNKKCGNPRISGLPAVYKQATVVRCTIENTPFAYAHLEWLIVDYAEAVTVDPIKTRALLPYHIAWFYINDQWT